MPLPVAMFRTQSLRCWWPPFMPMPMFIPFEKPMLVPCDWFKLLAVLKLLLKLLRSAAAVTQHGRPANRSERMPCHLLAKHSWLELR